MVSRKIRTTIVLLLGLTSIANGAQTLTWTNPTEYTNGDPLALSQLRAATLYCTREGETVTSHMKRVDRVFSAPIESTDVSTFEVPQGTWICNMTVTDTLEAQSDRSNSIQFTRTLLQDYPTRLRITIKNSS
jgi:hypothetical protein